MSNVLSPGRSRNTRAPFDGTRPPSLFAPQTHCWPLQHTAAAPPSRLPAAASGDDGQGPGDEDGAEPRSTTANPPHPPLHTSCTDTQTHSAPAAQRDVGGDCGVCPEKKKGHTLRAKQNKKPGTEEEVGAKFAKTPPHRAPHHHHQHPTKKKRKNIQRMFRSFSTSSRFFIFARLEKPLKHKIWMRRNKTEAPQINSSVLTTRHGATGGLSRTNRQRVIAGRRAARARSFSFTAPLLSGSVPSLLPRLVSGRQLVSPDNRDGCHRSGGEKQRGNIGKLTVGQILICQRPRETCC